ncbi:MAG: hypothetical protein V3V81_07875 [Candidatus Bathyarchaeia archaeon]
MKQLEIKEKKGIYDLNPNKAGVYVYNYRENTAFFCISKIFQWKKSDKIGVEQRKLVPSELRSKTTSNYIRLNIELLPKLIKLLEEFSAKQSGGIPKPGREQREIDDLIGKVGI